MEMKFYKKKTEGERKRRRLENARDTRLQSL